ncbi:hypothetical protein ACET3Z_026606 [Daucus carota]
MECYGICLAHLKSAHILGQSFEMTYGRKLCIGPCTTREFLSLTRMGELISLVPNYSTLRLICRSSTWLLRIRKYPSHICDWVSSLPPAQVVWKDGFQCRGCPTDDKERFKPSVMPCYWKSIDSLQVSKTNQSEEGLKALIMFRVTQWGKASNIMCFGNDLLWKANPKGALRVYYNKLSNDYWKLRQNSFDLVCSVDGV